MEISRPQRNFFKFIFIVTGFGVLLCTVSQIWFVNRIQVDKPVTITAHPDPEMRAFWYSPQCDNATLDAMVMQSTSCVFNEFDHGCKGNPHSSKSLAMIIVCAIFAGLIFIVKFPILASTSNEDLPWMIMMSILQLVFPVAIYLGFTSYEPMEQCNPVLSDYRYNVGYDLERYVAGCLWDIPKWEQVDEVQRTVLPHCQNVVLDLKTDKYQPKMWIRPIASPLVQRTIQDVTHKLFILMWVATALIVINFLMPLMFICVDKCKKLSAKCCQREVVCCRCGAKVRYETTPEPGAPPLPMAYVSSVVIS